MALTKERKQELVAAYREMVKKSQALVLTDYRGLPMSGLSTLRNKVREASGEFHITKNTLTEIALKEEGLPAPGEYFTGPTAVGFAFDDVPGVAKAIVDFAKDSQFVKIKGGLLGNKVLTAKQVEALASLPPLPVIRAQLLGLISAPASRLTGVVAGSVRQIVNVVKAYADKEQPAEAA
ncbi:MAG: 50S ribosomal protein L10 [Chloroflexi bacterium]|nr:50S ribosomal protein L10 [Chloroflexota bacterium]